MKDLLPEAIIYFNEDIKKYLNISNDEFTNSDECMEEMWKINNEICLLEKYLNGRREDSYEMFIMETIYPLFKIFNSLSNNKFKLTFSKILYIYNIRSIDLFFSEYTIANIKDERETFKKLNQKNNLYINNRMKFIENLKKDAIKRLELLKDIKKEIIRLIKIEKIDFKNNIEIYKNDEFDKVDLPVEIDLNNRLKMKDYILNNVNEKIYSKYKDIKNTVNYIKNLQIMKIDVKTQKYEVKILGKIKNKIIYKRKADNSIIFFPKNLDKKI